jgi:hypothetical protein
VDTFVDVVDAPADAVDATADAVDAPQDAPQDVDIPCTPNDSSTCFVVPGGWTLVAVDPTQSAACPSGFGAVPVNVFEGPTAGAGACTCPTCNETLPSCTTGAVQVFYDFGNGQCGLAGVPPQNNNNPPGVCDTDLYKGPQNNIGDVKLIPPDPVGGSCQAPSTKNPSGISYTGKDRVCTPNNDGVMGCDDAGICEPELPPPFLACVEAPGNKPCPAPFGHKHLVGTGVSFDCGACGCSETATCGGTMTLYSDGACQMDALSELVDGQCHSTGMPNRMNGSYIFAGAVATHACSITSVPSATNLTLDNLTTLCCGQ